MLNTQQLELIKATVPVLRASGVALTDYFYQRMLNNHPELKETFNLGHQRSGGQPLALFNAVAAYAYARTGYHRGLDALRRNGWKGSGQIPWEHEPNRGFLRALWALSVAAGRIGEAEEQERCAQFLRDSSEEAFQALSA